MKKNPSRRVSDTPTSHSEKARLVSYAGDGRRATSDGPPTSAWMNELRRMRDVEVHPADSPGVGLSTGFEVSIFGKALAQISEDPKGTVVRYYDQGWRFTRETSVVQRLIRAERKRNKKRRPDA